MTSWRNPDSRHAAWAFGAYGQAVLDTMDAVARSTGSEQITAPGPGQSGGRGQ
jgi:polyhydroxyalkanoate synthase